MITIEIRNVKLHAFHGIFEGEEKTGSPYNVDLAVTYDDAGKTFDNIDDTLNYADLYTIVREEMQVRRGLVEKVCDSIITRIKDQYPFILEILLSVHKLQPPIEQFQGEVGVRMSRKFNA